MKLLVIGGSGLIGSHVMRVAAGAGHVAVGTFRKFPVAGLRALDCADTAAVTVLLMAEQPDAVVFAAGWSWVDGCEDDSARAFAENAEQPARIAALCRQQGAQFAYFSSSYVFDGTAGPYRESDVPAPINVYSRAKLAGERQIQAAHPEALLFRVICVYGAEAQQKNFAYQVLKAMREGRVLRLPSDQEGNPTYAMDIARWVVRLLEGGKSGIWHLAGLDPSCSRPEWAAKLIAAFQNSGVVAHPGFSIQTFPTAELKQRALRPLKAGLLSDRLDALGLAPTDFDQSIRELLAASA